VALAEAVTVSDSIDYREIVERRDAVRSRLYEAAFASAGAEENGIT
jgi:hypothetical protein